MKLVQERKISSSISSFFLLFLSIGLNFSHLSAIPKTADLCIEFHVLLHQEWKFDPEKGHKVGIAFGHEWLGDWKESAVVMDTE